MVLDIATHFAPYSLNLSRREPVDLFVEIHNKSPEPTSATLQLMTGATLGLDAGGLRNREEIRVETLEPNHSQSWYFRVYPKINTTEGENPLLLRILEHHQRDFSLVKRKYNMNLALRVRK